MKNVIVDIEVLYTDGAIKTFGGLREDDDQSDSDLLAVTASQLRANDDCVAAARIVGNRLFWVGHETMEHFAARNQYSFFAK